MANSPQLKNESYLLPFTMKLSNYYFLYYFSVKIELSGADASLLLVPTGFCTTQTAPPTISASGSKSNNSLYIQYLLLIFIIFKYSRNTNNKKNLTVICNSTCGVTFKCHKRFKLFESPLIY